MAGPEDVRNGRKARLSPPGPTTAAGIWDAFRQFWAKSYAGDYLGLILITILYIPLKLVDEPFHHLFRLNDPRIQHPHAEIERVGVFYLFLYAVIVPAVILLVWNLILRRDPHKAHVSLLGLAGTVLLTALVTDIFKDAVGRPRPDLIARCRPRASTPSNVLIGIEVCTEPSHHLLHDGWRSFPSGHSSLSFAGLGWLSFFFASEMGVFRPRASLIAALAALAPLIGAGLIACSRLEDYRHDVFDVTVGSLLGLLLSWFNWRRFYPSLRSKGCDEPYLSPSNNHTSPDRVFRRIRDVEEGSAAEPRYALEDDDEV